LQCQDLGYRTPLDDFGISNVIIEEDEDVMVSVTPTMLNNTGEWVTVSFSGVENPNINDYIAAYSPSNVDITTTSPIKYQYANVSKTYLESGSGSIRFRLVNMYSDYSFALFRNGTAYPIFAKMSNNVGFTNYQQPLQPHIALTGVANQMRVSWASGNATTQYIKWGTSSGVYTNISQSEAYTYTAKQLCGGPANSYGWRDPGMLHTYVVEFDASVQQVFYTFGSDATSWSPEYSFATPVPVGPSNGVRIVAYGDMGKAEIDQSLEHWEEIPSINTTRNVEALIDDGYELVLHVGDIAYAVGYSAQWDEFMDQITPVASRVPYMTNPGNHERDYINSNGLFNVTDSGGECGIPYEHRFLMPGTDHETQWYSFDFGNVHVIMFSTELNFSIGSAQYEFLESDLASVDRSMTPWVIASGHRPMYVDSNNTTPFAGDVTVADELVHNIDPLFVKFGVNLGLWGHHHSYQRTCPISNRVCMGQGYPVHAVIGMAGMGLSTDLDRVQPDYIEVVDDGEYGYCTIETTADTLHMTFFNNANQVRDDFYLQQ